MKLKSLLLIGLFSILLTGCGGNDESGNEPDFESGWTICSESEGNKRLNSIKKAVESSSYRVFDKELTIKTVYSIKTIDTAMDNPKDQTIGVNSYVTTYKYNPSNLSFEYKLEHTIDDDTSIRSILFTTGKVNNKDVVQVQERNSQYEEYDIENIEVQKGNSVRDTLEDCIDGYLYYFGLSIPYFVNNIDEYITEIEPFEGSIVKSNTVDVNYFKKNSDGLRIKSDQNLEEYKKTSTGKYIFESSCSASCDFMMENNMILKGEFNDETTYKDYNEKLITNETKVSSVVTNDTCDLKKIAFISG